MNNLHIAYNYSAHPSRILKQVESISFLSEIKHIFIATLHRKDLNKNEKVSDKILFKRFDLEFLFILSLFKGPLKYLWSLFKGPLKYLWSLFKGPLKYLWSLFKGPLKYLWSLFKGPLKYLWSLFKGPFRYLWSLFKGPLKYLWSLFKGPLKYLWSLFKGPFRYLWSLFKGPFRYLVFAYKIFFFFRKKNISIINIHHCVLLPLGCFLKFTFGAKLIYDTHELETETVYCKGLKKKLIKWLECLLIKKVNLIFVVSEPIADWYEKTYNITRPIVLLNAPRAAHVKKTNYFRETFHLRDEQIILLYQGGLTAERGVDILLEAFKKKIDDKLVIIFMGYGELEKEIQSSSKSYNNIFFHKAVPPGELLNYTASADVGIHLIKNNCLNHNFCMPNKLFEYAMAGLPVIVSNVKEMSAFVIKYQMGVVVMMEDDAVTSFNKAIERLLSMDLSVLRQNAKKAALDNSWEHQEAKMIHSYQKFLNLV